MSEMGAYLYYMAPMHNAPLIALFGILSYNMVHSQPELQARSIADPFVNRRRHRRFIGKRSLHDYVPLYWATHTPMQYVVTMKECILIQSDLVFFVLDAEEVLQLEGVWSTDGNAASNETTFYEGAGALPRLDWDVLRTPDCWSREYKRRKSAEVLVPDEVPVGCMHQICVYNRVSATKLRRAVGQLRKLAKLRQQLICEIRPDSSLYYREMRFVNGRPQIR